MSNDESIRFISDNYSNQWRHLIEVAEQVGDAKSKLNSPHRSSATSWLSALIGNDQSRQQIAVQQAEHKLRVSTEAFQRILIKDVMADQSADLAARAGKGMALCTDAAIFLADLIDSCASQSHGFDKLAMEYRDVRSTPLR